MSVIKRTINFITVWQDEVESATRDRDYPCLYSTFLLSTFFLISFLFFFFSLFAISLFNLITKCNARVNCSTTSRDYARGTHASAALFKLENVSINYRLNINVFLYCIVIKRSCGVCCRNISRVGKVICYRYSLEKVTCYHYRIGRHQSMRALREYS